MQHFSRNSVYLEASTINNEAPGLALNYINLLVWRVLLMVKYVLTMMNIGFTKNNAE